MVFPDTLKMRVKPEDALVQTTYKCTASRCDFSACQLAVQSSEKLLKFRTKEVCSEIIDDIDQHQDDFLPSALDGFYVNRMGYELVHMRREDATGKGITGFIEYNDLRRKSMEYYDTKKIVGLAEAINKSKSNCAVM